jgi:hypothetical protein
MQAAMIGLIKLAFYRLMALIVKSTGIAIVKKPGLHNYNQACLAEISVISKQSSVVRKKIFGS